jgi:DinB family protein
MDSYLTRLQQELEDAIAGATPADLGRGPAGKWTPAQILEHLYRTYRGTNYGIAKCLEKGTPLVTRATLKHRVGTFLICDLGYVPGGRKSPERAMPQGMPIEEILQSIFLELQTLDSGLVKLETQFGAKTKVFDHPLIGPLTTDQWRKFHLAHGRHHARQIRERLVRAKGRGSGE